MEFKGVNINEGWVKSFETAAKFKDGVPADTKAAWAEFGITEADLTTIHNAAKAPSTPPSGGGN